MATAFHDGYKNKVYAGEAQAPGIKTLTGKPAINAEIRRVLGRKRVQAILPGYWKPRFEITSGQGGGWYHGGGTITLAASRGCVLRDFVIVHELAHFAHMHNDRFRTHRKHRVRGRDESHGPGFTTALLFLYKAAYGQERAQALNDSLAEYGARALDEQRIPFSLRPGVWPF
jgi:hypothetical protein